jgi:putative ABC transport system permease protein
MSPARLVRLSAKNLERHRGALMLAGLGVVVALASLVFFLGLSQGVSRVVLGDIFPEGRLEVIAPRTGLVSSLAEGLTGGLMGGPRLDDTLVEQLRQRPEVAQVYPKMILSAPGKAWGGRGIFGADRYAELIADGIDPRLAEDLGEVFARDPRSVPGGPAPGQPPRCDSDLDCRPHDPGSYCAIDVHECQYPVPAAVSPFLLEIYNGHIARTFGYPKVSRSLAGVFRNFPFQTELGNSFIGGRTAEITRRRRLFLVGISDRAIRVGVTLPLEVVKQWNSLFRGPEAGKAYSSLLIQAKKKSDVTPLAAHIKSLGFEIADNGAEQAGLFVTLLTLLLALLSLLLVTLAGLNIAHTFITLVAERRREIGLLRAVGASKGDIRGLILFEASCVGAVFGVTGVALGMAVAHGVDVLSRRVVPDFPFKPQSFFAFPPWLLGGAVAFAILCALAGAWVPASRAARLQPAEALSG